MCALGSNSLTSDVGEGSFFSSDVPKRH